MLMPLTGADTIPAVTQDLIDQAMQHLGVKPAFWGRYFSITSPGGSYTSAEGGPLATNGIKLMPIARQTNHVNGTNAQGQQDGIANVDDLVNRVGAAALKKHKGEILFFLDTEESPVVSSDYYSGWAQSVVAHGKTQKLKIAPAVYLHHNQTDAWDQLVAAANAGHGPRAAWVVAELNNACASPVPNWDPKFVLPNSNPGFVPPCPIVVRQFALDCFDGLFDFSIINPSKQTFMLNRLLSTM